MNVFTGRTEGLWDLKFWVSCVKNAPLPRGFQNCMTMKKRKRREDRLAALMENTETVPRTRDETQERRSHAE